MQYCVQRLNAAVYAVTFVSCSPADDSAGIFSAKSWMVSHLNKFFKWGKPNQMGENLKGGGQKTAIIHGLSI